MENRIIKFRVWDHLKGRMITEDVDQYASFIGNGEVITSAVFKKNVLIQFTGRVDKSGKEIYPGDILEVYLDCEPVGDLITCYVGWNERLLTWTLYDLDGTEYEYLCEFESEFLEIKANVFSNPELVKNQNEKIDLWK